MLGSAERRKRKVTRTKLVWCTLTGSSMYSRALATAAVRCAAIISSVAARLPSLPFSDVESLEAELAMERDAVF
jgi:hypothetical protein